MTKTGVRIDLSDIKRTGLTTSCLVRIILDRNKINEWGCLYYVQMAYEYNKKHHIKEDIRDDIQPFRCSVTLASEDKDDEETAKKELFKKARRIAFKKVYRLYADAALYGFDIQNRLMDMMRSVKYNIEKV